MRTAKWEAASWCSMSERSHIWRSIEPARRAALSAGSASVTLVCVPASSPCWLLWGFGCQQGSKGVRRLLDIEHQSPVLLQNNRLQVAVERSLGRKKPHVQRNNVRQNRI